MKTYNYAQLFGGILVALAFGSSVSCQTYYDQNGNPVQAVDPGVAVAGAAAAAVVTAIAVDNHNDHHRGPSGPGPGPGPGRYGPP